MSQYVSCQHCINKDCERYGGPYGYTFCDKYISDTLADWKANTAGEITLPFTFTRYELLDVIEGV